MNNKKITIEEKIISLQVEVISALRYYCNLKHEDITKLIQEHDILNYIRLGYEIFHVQGIFPTLFELQEYLEKRGIKIEVKGLGVNEGVR